MFKRGDRIRCIDSDGTNYLNTGDIYPVGSARDDGIFGVNLYDSEGYEYRLDRFELVRKPNVPDWSIE